MRTLRYLIAISAGFLAYGRTNLFWIGLLVSMFSFISCITLAEIIDYFYAKKIKSIDNKWRK